jgi:hypothetical protein
MKILKFGPQNHEANCGPNFSVPLKLTVLYCDKYCTADENSIHFWTWPGQILNVTVVAVK